MHMIFITPTFYIKKICFMIALFDHEHFCGVFRQWPRIVSQPILNKNNSHTGTILLFKVSLDNNSIVFYNCNAK